MDVKKTLEKINNGRYKVEAAFVFCLWEDPERFEDFQYVNEGKDKTLQDEDAIFYWNLGKQMYHQGIKNFDPISIDSFLTNKKAVKKKYDEYGGYQSVSELKSLINVENTDGYFDKILRMNSLSTICTAVDNMFNNVEKFDNATSEDVYNAMELLNSSVSLSVQHNADIEDLVVTKKYIEDCESGINTGLSYSKNCPLLNYTTLGLPVGDVYLLAGHSGIGKALAVTEPVLTPNGFVPMGEIKLGDYVIGEDGKKTKVIGVYPQGKRLAYRITFEDGTKIICDREHLWKYKTYVDCERKRDWRVTTTGEMFDSGVIRKDGTKKFRLPLTNPIVDFEEKKELSIPPYTLGALIGDGYLCQYSIQFTTTEQDIVDRINNEIEKYGVFTKRKEENIQYIYHTKLEMGNNYLRKALMDIGLFGCKSGDKYIPEEYLYSSYENRLALAQGLIDTDGCVNKKGHISYSTTSKQLASDIMFLLRSLGKQVRLRAEDRRESGKKNIEYEVYVCGIHSDLFSSIKHNEKFQNRKIPKRGYHYDMLRIENIEELDEMIDMQCIRVDNDSHTYLCRNFVVTHNSSFAFENMAIPLAENGIPVCVLSNEMNINAYQNMLTAHILTKDLNYWKLTRKKIKIGDYTEEDKEMLEKTIQISEEKYKGIKFVKLFDNNTGMLMKYIKKLANQGVKCFIWDTFKNDDISDGSEEWLQLLKNSRKVFNLVSKLNISMVMTFQLALYTTNQRYLDASCLSASKQIKEVVSELIMMRKLWHDEYTGEKYDCKPFRYNKDNKKIKEEITLDPEKTYAVVFINKTRNDEGSKEILYQWQGHYNRWTEIGYCTIRNDHRGVG